MSTRDPRPLTEGMPERLRGRLHGTRKDASSARRDARTAKSATAIVPDAAPSFHPGNPCTRGAAHSKSGTRGAYNLPHGTQPWAHGEFDACGRRPSPCIHRGGNDGATRTLSRTLAWTPDIGEKEDRESPDGTRDPRRPTITRLFRKADGRARSTPRTGLHSALRARGRERCSRRTQRKSPACAGLLHSRVQRPALTARP